MYIGLITLQTGLCLVVLTAPTFVLCWTVYNLCVQEVRGNIRVSILLNTMLVIVIVVITQLLQLSTLNVHAIVGYLLAGTLLAIFTLLLCANWLMRSVQSLVFLLQSSAFWRKYRGLSQDINAPRVRIEQ